MKNPKEFVKTIYLGDRICKSLLIDGWNRCIKLQVDTISRIRDLSGNWNFYTLEDIEDGLIVFDSVDSFSIEPQGLLPNDWIGIVNVESIDVPDLNNNEDMKYHFIISLGAVDKDGKGQELTLKIVANSIYLEDPKKPNDKILK